MSNGSFLLLRTTCRLKTKVTRKERPGPGIILARLSFLVTESTASTKIIPLRRHTVSSIRHSASSSMNFSHPMSPLMHICTSDSLLYPFISPSRHRAQSTEHGVHVLYYSKQHLADESTKTRILSASCPHPVMMVTIIQPPKAPCSIFRPSLPLDKTARRPRWIFDLGSLH